MTASPSTMRRPFVVTVALVAVGVVVLAVVIGVFGTRQDRPEGVAERWLTAAGDLTRTGVHRDAAARAGKDGPLPLAESIVAGAHAAGDSAYASLEVGRAAPAGGNTAGPAGVSVPVKLELRGTTTVRRFDLLLRRRGASWTVTAVGPASASLRVPTDGGPAATKAGPGVFIGAVVVGIVLAAATSGLVRLAGRGSPPAGRAPAPA